MHARRVVLELQLLELAQFRKIDHLVVASTRLSRGEAHHDSVHDHVVFGRKVGIESHSKLDEGGEPAFHPYAALIDAVDSREALEQRALATAIASGDSEELAPLNLKRHPVEGGKAL